MVYNLGKIRSWTVEIFAVHTSLSVFIAQNVVFKNFGVAIHQQSNEAISSSLATSYGVL